MKRKEESTKRFNERLTQIEPHHSHLKVRIHNKRTIFPFERDKMQIGKLVLDNWSEKKKKKSIKILSKGFAKVHQISQFHFFLLKCSTLLEFCLVITVISLYVVRKEMHCIYSAVRWGFPLSSMTTNN